jgi:hypothetical protein
MYRMTRKRDCLVATIIGLTVAFLLSYPIISPMFLIIPSISETLRGSMGVARRSRDKSIAKYHASGIMEDF